jgi:hypothetical protein
MSMNRFQKIEVQDVLLVAIRKNGREYEWRIPVDEWREWSDAIVEHSYLYPELNSSDIQLVTLEIQELAEIAGRKLIHE